MVSTLGDYDINSLNKLWSTVTNERHKSFNYNSVQYLGEQEPVFEKFNPRLFVAGEIIMAALNISLGIELIKKLVFSWICQFVQQKNDKNLRLDLNWYFEGNFDHYKVFKLLHQLGLRGNRFAVVLYNGLCRVRNPERQFGINLTIPQNMADHMPNTHTNNVVMLPEKVKTTLYNWVEPDLSFKKISHDETISKPFPTIYYLHEYYPWSEVQGLPYTNEYRKTDSILNLKNNHKKELDYYRHAIEDFLRRTEFALRVCAIPSHLAGVRTEHLWEIFSNMAPEQKVTFEDSLMRVVDTNKKSTAKGVLRNPEIDYLTMGVISVTPGACYLILDDVTTSGASMMAATRLLYEKGAGKVFCLALSKTTHLNNNSENMGNLSEEYK